MTSLFSVEMGPAWVDTRLLAALLDETGRPGDSDLLDLVHLAGRLLRSSDVGTDLRGRVRQALPSVLAGPGLDAIESGWVIYVAAAEETIEALESQNLAPDLPAAFSAARDDLESLLHGLAALRLRVNSDAASTERLDMLLMQLQACARGLDGRVSSRHGEWLALARTGVAAAHEPPAWLRGVVEAAGRPWWLDFVDPVVLAHGRAV